MKIIGTNLAGHDSGIFIIDPEKKEIYAINTERITRRKHDVSSIVKILSRLNLKNEEIYFENCYSKENFGLFLIRTARNDILNFLNIFSNKEVKEKYSSLSNKEKLKSLLRKNLFKGARFGLKNFYYDILYNIKNDFFNKNLIKNYLKKITLAKNIEMDFIDHHLSHAASAYYFSPYSPEERVLVFTLDAEGDGYNSKLYLGCNNNLEYITGSKSLFFKSNKNNPNSSNQFTIGYLYSYFTEAMDLVPNSDEGKIEALACYAKNPKNNLYNELMSLFKIDSNLSILPDLKKAEIYSDINFLKQRRKELGDENFCGAIQLFLEDFILEYIKEIIKKYKIKKFCFSGGIFANVKLNLRIYEESGAESIYIFPAMGDGGAFAGSAVLKMIDLKKDISWIKNIELPYFGDEFNEQLIKEELEKEKYNGILNFKKIENWHKLAAELISKNNIIALYQGKMEFGPRALGNRSVLGNPLNNKTREIINSTIKRRPYYQPFCPTVLESEREHLFVKAYPNKHMTVAFRLKPKEFEKLPSAGHIDGTARPQFIEEKDNPNFYRIILEFKKLTGYGIVVNTSFNLHGRTIVMTPEDAIEDFIDCGLDYMFMPPYFVEVIKKK